MEVNEEVWMRMALDEARRAVEVGEVPVGCVVLDPHGEVVARGHNMTNATKDPTAHAELVALRSMANVAQAHTLVVTLEPCIMCASALRMLPGHHVLERVIFGAHNDRFGGSGTVLPILDSPALSLDSCCGLKQQPPHAVLGGVLADEAVHVLKEFYAQENDFAPPDKRRKKKS